LLSIRGDRVHAIRRPARSLSLTVNNVGGDRGTDWV